MNDNQWFLIRTTSNQATAVIAGPLSGAESYAAFATASMEDDAGAVLVLPASIVADITSRIAVAAN